MSDRGHYPAGVPCWIDTAQPNPEAALDFYGALFGWEFAGPGAMPGDPPGRYYVARVRGKDVAGIGSQLPGSPTTPGWMTYIAVKSADAAADRARGAGAAVVAGPFDAPPAGRMAVIQDPAGARLAVWEAGRRQGAQLVNEPSAWAMSLLATRDPDRAKAFYHDVFGWETDEFAPGASLFRLFGYVGGEPTQPVPRDVVGVMTELDQDAAWNVDIWVTDVNATAARAAELGGGVVIAPGENPGFLNAVLTDPQGATLSVSQLLVPASAA